MSRLNNISILNEIEVDKRHVENFSLESDKGTKKLREKFRKNAVVERNKYIEKQKRLFNYYSRRVYFELDGRINRLFPDENTDLYDELNGKILKYENLVIETNDKLSVGVKLGLEILVSSITDTISLRSLNDILKVFIDKFSEANITLTSEDFIYSMFTKAYMDKYFESQNDDNFNDTIAVWFEKIYFECPKIILHIKMCLRYLLNKYDTQLVQYMNQKVSQTLFNENIVAEQVISLYSKCRNDLVWSVEKDPYRNLNIFLNKKAVVADYLPDAFVREKKFSTFAIGESYVGLSDEGKAKYNAVIKDLFGVANGLKEYYRYEAILKDLIKRYKNKDSSKALFEQKSKEITLGEKMRLKIVKEFYNSGKPKLFGFMSKDLSKVSKLRINEELVKLNQLYEEFEDAVFNYKLSSSLDDACSIYDVFSCSLLSFDYLRKTFFEKFGNEQGYNLENEFRRYIKFLFSPFSDFLRKINGLIDYDIAEVLADKYKILGLNVEIDDMSKEKIDITCETLDFIVRSLCIEENNLNSFKMNYICKVKDIKPLDGWEIVNEEII